MSTATIIAIIVVVIIVILVLWIISAYNKFVKMNNKVKEAFSTMDVFLKKRYDLIPNLVETIKGYTKHESQTLENVIRARNMALNAQTMSDKIASEKNFQSMLGPIYAVGEQYPNLKADQNFIKLQDELQNIENEIANSRKYYNAICVKFNNLVEMFPTNILANIFHYKQQPLYEIEDTQQRENVKVQF